MSLFSSDHDLDDDVDGRDFLIWQRFFGQTVQNGDANSDYQIDGVDLIAWQSQYGSVAANTLVVALPEPSVAVVVTAAFLILSGVVLPRMPHPLARARSLDYRFEPAAFNSKGRT